MDKKELSPSNDDWVEGIADQFTGIRRLVDSVFDNNEECDKFHKLLNNGESFSEELIKPVIDQINSEQIDTFKKLAKAGETAPYEELEKRRELLSIELGNLASEIALGSELLKNNQAELERQSKQILKCIPRATAILGQAVTNSQVSLVMEQQKREQLMNDLREEEVRLRQIYEYAAKQWPIPIVLSQKNTTVSDHETDDRIAAIRVVKENLTYEHLAEINETTEPTVHLENSKKANYVNASKPIAELLSSMPDSLLSYKELAEMVYGADEKAYRKIQQLLSKYFNGKNPVMDKILKENGIIIERVKQTTERGTATKTPGKSPSLISVKLDQNIESIDKELFVLADPSS